MKYAGPTQKGDLEYSFVGSPCALKACALLLPREEQFVATVKLKKLQGKRGEGQSFTGQPRSSKQVGSPLDL